MKIVWFNWRDVKNPEAGGAEVFTHEVCRRLVKMGYEITLFSSSFEGDKKEEEVDGIITVRSGGKYTVYKEAKDYFAKNKEKFNIVIDEINTRPFLTPNYVHNIPIIGLIHQLAREFWLYETPFPLNLIGYFFLEKYWLKKYRNLPMITVSESTRKDLEELGFKRVHLVPEGIDVKPLEIVRKETRPTLLFVGRFKKAKKPDDAIRAFKVVKNELPDAQLWMVGDGYMMPELKKLADSDASNHEIRIEFNEVGNRDVSDTNEENNTITFFGKISNEKKFELMARAHLLLMPGVREGWGLVVTEANAMGTPAIAYDVPGLRDSVVNNVTGMLVPPRDYVAMGIAAVDLLKDEQKRTLYSENAIKWAQRFSWDRTAEEFARIIEEYAENSRKLISYKV